jgi:hypothetical protein
MPGFALAETGVVAGTLRGIDGKPAAHVRVGVMPIPEVGQELKGSDTLVNLGQTDDAGRFLLEEVLPGRYYIVAGRLDSPTFYPGVLEIDEARTIEVRAMATVHDVDFEVMVSSATFSDVSVTGRIVLNRVNAPMPPIITIQGSRVNPSPGLRGQALLPEVVVGMSMTVPVAPNGLFKVTLPAGIQRLYEVGLPEGYSAVAATSGGRNVLNQPIDVKAWVELLVSVDVGDIRTRYRLLALVREDSTERPLAGECIELVQSSGEVVRLTVNPQGVVTFPRLLPGSYVVRLVSDGFDVPEKQVAITNGSVQVDLRARKKPR